MGAKNLLSMDKSFRKIMSKVAKELASILAGRKGSPQQQVLLNNFRRPWRTQRKFYPLAEKTEERKERKKEDFILVQSGDLGKAVKNSTKATLRGDSIILEAEVPVYGEAHQFGTDKIPARPFFDLTGYDKIVYGLIESLLTLELNKLGIKSKEIK